MSYRGPLYTKPHVDLGTISLLFLTWILLREVLNYASNLFLPQWLNLDYLQVSTTINSMLLNVFRVVTLGICVITSGKHPEVSMLGHWTSVYLIWQCSTHCFSMTMPAKSSPAIHQGSSVPTTDKPYSIWHLDFAQFILQRFLNISFLHFFDDKIIQ